MPKAFFSHASEDKALVEVLYNRVRAASPDLSGWLDKYEILAGESLIERIAAGMDESDKFVIFLSPVSIKKPWVKRELRRAIMREIEGVNPDFIIPVLIGEITAVPAFLEDKKYIPLHRMTEAEWLPELVAAIRGIRPDPAEALEENVAVHAESVPGQPHIVRIAFEARFWAVKVDFEVHTSEDIVQAGFSFPAASGVLTWQGSRTRRGERVFAFMCEQPEIRPGYPVVFELEFAPGVDALGAIERIGRFDPLTGRLISLTTSGTSQP